MAKVARLAVIAENIGVPIHHLALLWCLANPNVSTVILAASRKEQLTDNLSALTSKDALTSDVIARIEEIVQNKPDAPARF